MPKPVSSKPIEVDDFNPSFFDDQVPKLPGRRRSRLSLGKIMISLIYFALLFWVGRYVYWTNGVLARMMLGGLLGLGVCLIGLWLAFKLEEDAFIGWIVFVIGFAGMSFATIGFLVLPTVPILIGAMIYLSFRQRSNNQDALLGILALSAESGMPLMPGVKAFASQVKGGFRSWADTLAELLRRGVTLPEAIDSIGGIVPRPSRLLIRMGHDSGSLSRGLREAVHSRNVQQPTFQIISTQLAYICWVACTGIFISGFLMYFILPKFEAIFHDFGVELPEITKFLIRWSHLAVDFFFVPVLLGFVLGVCFVGSMFTGGGMYIPLIDRLLGRRHTILILRCLVLFVEAEQPMSSALDLLAHWYPTNWVRRKLSKASSDVSHGHDWIDSLHSWGLLTASDVGLLNSAQRAGNLSWALRELVATSERRWSFRLQGLMQLVFIGSMMILGAFVFLLAVAYFAPLTTLILRLS